MQTFGLASETDKDPTYNSSLENQNTLNFSNGLSIGTKIKPKNLLFHLDFNRRAFHGAFLTPYIKIDIARQDTKVTPHLGNILAWRGLKWNQLLHLSQENVRLQHRAEYQTTLDQYKVHVALAQNLNLKEFSNVGTVGLVSVARDRVEGSVHFGRQGTLNTLDYLNFGLAYHNARLVDLAATFRFNPFHFKNTDEQEVLFGIRKTIGKTFYARAFVACSKVATYQAQYVATPNITLTGTLEVNHGAKEGYAGYGGKPFRFGIQASFNA